MRWNLRWVLPVSLAMGVFGCQPQSSDHDAAIVALEEKVASLIAEQQSLKTLSGQAEADRQRLESEKATRSELDEVASRSKPWMVGVPIGAALLTSSEWTQAPHGVRLPPDVISMFLVSYTLPPEYAEGTDLELRFRWTKDPSLTTSCQFKVVVSLPWVVQTNAEPFFVPSTIRGASDEYVLVQAPSDDRVKELVAEVSGTDGGRSLRAGDTLSTEFLRVGADADDTCAGPSGGMQVNSISVHPKSS